MPQFGSNIGMVSQNISTVVDPQGNQIVSSDNSFGASPLGVAARTQSLYGIPNANFNLTPPDVNAVIDTSNPLPYWEVSSQGSVTAEMYYDDTRQQWSVNLDPVGAGSGDFVTLKTRSYLINDSGLSLRQKAYATLEKVGTYSSTNQWNLVLTATYFDATGTQLSSFAIGTVAQNATWTGINGYTTSGTATISASAAYVDLDFTLTASATVSGTATVHIDALLIETSNAAVAGSFVITETFTSSGTWTRPTGGDYLIAVAGYSGGNGGDGNTGRWTRTGATVGSIRGNAGVFGIIRDVYVGDQTSVSVGIGAGGAGGVGGSAIKTAGDTTNNISGTATAAGVGGNTTFGSYLICASPASNANGVATGTVTTSAPFPDTIISQVAFTEGTSTAVSFSYMETNGFTVLPYISSYAAAGQNGTDGTALGATTGGRSSTRGGYRTLGGTAGLTGLAMCPGGVTGTLRLDNTTGGAYTGSTLPTTTGTYYAGSAGKGGAGGGGGGGVYFIDTTAGTQLSARGGNGGSAAANSGSGGGAGGGAAIGNNATSTAGTTAYTNSSGTAIGGNGGNGGSGLLVVAYVS